ncbi:hypothetical protein LE181_03875 [Streptomyces sp. SCA3-4]|uniref:hypothetical protein n=1 Tax=Streptomyces sichuanensis TaxID=2871810 RepID=UPI001CE2FA46|nr:hypothetical protein [Streptomyces sichuanensis]MCA6091308.1 hypothetical protein [Streptomyces sichuanensis]
MKSRTFRLAPAVAAVTAGLLMAGTAGAAVAAPSEESPSPTSSAASPQDDETKGWEKHGPYDDENSCQKAGKEGQSHNKWREYKCKREYNNDKYRYYWWLYTH